MIAKYLSRWLGRHSTPARLPQHFRATVEGLEARWNLSNVTASVLSGVLTLTATAGAFNDKITIGQGSDPGQLDLTGTGTTINGASSRTVTGVRSIVCTMKGGDDTITFHANIKGDITFNGGGGTNELEIGNAFIGGSVHYLNGTTAANEDNLTINGFGIIIGRDVTADFGEGTSQAILSGAVIGGKAAITAGSGADIVSTNGLTLTRSLTASLGNGDNLVGIESANDNISQANAPTFLGGALSVTTGSGADTIEIGQEDSVDILGSVTLLTGNEATKGDTVTIDNTTFSAKVTLDLGAGNDLALFETVDVLNASTDIGGTLTIFGRAGVDTIGFGQASGARVVFLSSPAVLDGNGGNDGLLLINLWVDGVNVDSVAKLGLPPSHFESIVF